MIYSIEYNNKIYTMHMVSRRIAKQVIIIPSLVAILPMIIKKYFVNIFKTTCKMSQLSLKVAYN